MRRTRRQTKRSSPSSENSNDKSKKKKKTETVVSKVTEGSSSESDIENYLQKASDIDLNSTFFKTTTIENKDFDQIEKDIFSGVNRLSDSESDDDTVESKQPFEIETIQAVTDSVNSFEHINVYNKKLEEAKKQIEIYKSRKGADDNVDVSDILAIGESKPDNDAILGSSDFDTFSDSGKEDWEEVDNIEEKSLIPEKGVEITVELPGNVRKKKGVDIMDIIKRRLNRIKKENQVYIHKVHLLCWIAHGNYLNKTLNSENLMGLALSLLPSKQSYPPERLDLSYLENITQWFSKTIKIVNKNSEGELSSILEQQIFKKEAYDNKMFVYIFICILRSLAIKCRLILSLQVEPLRPSLFDLNTVRNKVSKNTPTGSEKTVLNKSKSSKSRVVQNNGTPKSQSSKKKNTPAVVSTKVNRNRIETKSKNLKLASKVNFEDICSLESDDNEKSTGSLNKIVKNNTEATSTKLDKTTKDKCKSTEKSKTRSDKIVVLKNNEEKLEKSNYFKRVDEKNVKPTTSDKTDERISTKKLRSKVKEDKIQTKSENENKSLQIEASTARRSSKQKTNETLNVKIEHKSNTTKGQKLTLERDLRKSSRSSITTGRTRTGKHENGSTEELHVKNKKEQDIVSPKPSPQSTSKNTDSNNSKKKVTNPLGQFKMKMPFKLKSNTQHLQKTDEKQKQAIPSASKRIEVPLIKKKIQASQDKIENIPQLDGANDDASTNTKKTKTKPNLGKLKNDSEDKCLVKKHPKRLKNVVQYKEIDSDNDFETTQSVIKKNSNSNPIKKREKLNLNKLKITSKKIVSQSSSESDKSKYFGSPLKSGKLDVRGDIMSLIKQNLAEEKTVLRSKLVKHKRTTRSSSSDSDYMPAPIKKKAVSDDFKVTPVKVKRRIPAKKDLLEMEKKKQIEKEEQKKKNAINVWIEVFVEAEEKWISVDVVKGQVHCVKELYTRARHPISYILSWDNAGFIKDVTKRYCINWNTVTRKLRVDNKWWNETLLPYKSPPNPRDREEDEDFARQQLEQPLPKTISEYKNHPLYVLKRHLLKFEAIYPPDALTLGFIRGEPVYSRECVYVLHSREIWLKHAKVVKPGETPYKIVKARPKYDRLSNSFITDKPLEVFGKWQVEDYVPPTAENGIVPRNAYGNVELFKDCMLPKGTVHLQLAGLNKVARKMNIDCAPAVIGFDFHSGWSHPTFDGFIVCEEFSEQLVAAWFTEQEESEKKAQEKIEKRVYDNWRRLIRGLLIRERLKVKYDFGGPSSTSKKNKGKSKSSLSIKKRQIRSDSESESEK